MRLLPQHVAEMTDKMGDAIAGVSTSSAPDAVKQSTLKFLWELMRDVQAYNVQPSEFSVKLESIWQRRNMNEEAEDRKPECRNNVGRCRSYLGLMLQFGPEYNDKREWMQEKPAIVAHVNRKRIFFCWHAHKIGEQRYDRERPDLSMLHQQFLDAIAQQKIWVLTGDELLEAHCAVIRREIEWALTTIERKEQEIFEWQQKLAALEDEKWGAR